MIKFGYFETGSNDALMVPLKNYLGTEPTNDKSCTMHFKKVDNALDTSTVVVEFTPGKTTEALEAIHEVMGANPKDGFIVIGDDNDSNFINHGDITALGAITL